MGRTDCKLANGRSGEGARGHSRPPKVDDPVELVTALYTISYNTKLPLVRPEACYSRVDKKMIVLESRTYKSHIAEISFLPSNESRDCLVSRWACSGHNLGRDKLRLELGPVLEHTGGSFLMGGRYAGRGEGRGSGWAPAGPGTRGEAEISE
ncbi:hypothetical protein E2C01_024394 [Portunus trituberculatus]|uniref:Uncharacterized protein n=1 Tax=Portunus trituberculatus TaxID=210409 RepID=A0A5B7ECK6_PORTR|nr:hypothetical protein [Portunus trituberculatus]